MEFVKLTFQGNSYDYKDSTNIKMCVLGCFLMTDLRCGNDFYRKWALDNNQQAAGGNLTDLYKENENIFLADIFSEEEVPTELKMTVQQLVQLLDDWRDKVCATKPREIIIKYENNQFIIETKDQ